MNIRYWFIYFLMLLFSQTACESNATQAVESPEDAYAHLGLSTAEVDSLLSLEQVDDYPLYTMHHYEAYEIGSSVDAQPLAIVSGNKENQWACSLFAALANPDARLYGRNFDWEFSPALLLFTYPPDGYASAAMVDIAYLGFEGAESAILTICQLR